MSRRSNSRNKCASHKVGYKNHRRAMMAIQRVAERFPEAAQLPCRAYQCRQCRRWHLSSKPKE